MAKNRGSRRWLLANIGLAALTVLDLALVGNTVFQPTRSTTFSTALYSTEPSTTPTVTTVAPLRVTILGDSFTRGGKLGELTARGWPAILSARHGWLFHLAATAGTGFVNPGRSERNPFLNRMDDVVSSDPDLVIVEGGGNDISYSQQQERACAVTVLRSLRKRLPHAKVVLLGPLWTQQRTPPGLAGIRSAFKSAAKATDVSWVDPTGWFQGRARLVGHRAHPTDLGQAYLAVRISRALRALGLIRATPLTPRSRGPEQSSLLRSRRSPL